MIGFCLAVRRRPGGPGCAPSLLHDVCQLVCQQAPTFRSIGLVPAMGEANVVTQRVRPSARDARCQIGNSADVDTGLVKTSCE
jgi:hypothetical protein